jgi:dTDP-4-dehydrorhamnose reductase
MKWLVTGGSGQLGRYVLRLLAQENETVVAWSGSQKGTVFGTTLRRVELSNPVECAAAFREVSPDIVLHLAGMTAVGSCFRDPVLAKIINVDATARLANLCAAVSARMIFTSTDLVFDGAHGPYDERAAPHPLSAYGQSKLDAEKSVLSAPRHVVVRLSLLFGPSLGSDPAYFDQQVQALREGKPLTLFYDEWRTPLGMMEAASAVVELGRADAAGIFHVGGPERMSRAEMGIRLANCLRLSPAPIRPVGRDSVASGEPRPEDASLDSSRFRALAPRFDFPSYETAIARFYQL